VLTGVYGAAVLGPLLEQHAPPGLDVRVVAVENRFFGGNIAVTGLLTGADLAPVVANQPAEATLMLPDVCLSEGRFLDGSALEDLPRPVHVVPADGASLRQMLLEAAGTSVPPAAGVR
jgi:NifB/MoaA-like Fe-S oxidoreductase